MVISNLVTINWSGTNKEYFENLGYRYTGHSTQLQVPVHHLLRSSDILVTLKCDICGRIFDRRWVARNMQFEKHKKDLCASCCKTGSFNSQYNKDRSEILKYARSFNKQNPMCGKTHKESAKLKMSEIKARQISDGTFDILSNNRGYKLEHLSLKTNEIFYADSALEKFRMIQLDNDPNIRKWTKRHHIKIPYIYDNKSKYYVPDFLIELLNGILIIEEVKGWVKDIDLVKKEHAEIYCKNNNMIYRFITQNELNINGEYSKFLKENINK